MLLDAKSDKWKCLMCLKTPVVASQSPLDMFCEVNKIWLGSFYSAFTIWE